MYGFQKAIGKDIMAPLFLHPSEIRMDVCDLLMSFTPANMGSFTSIMHSLHVDKLFPLFMLLKKPLSTKDPFELTGS